ncbi:MAG: MerR family transcriptional regulator [Firmicutes bacterium]|nr:MerR family transcriptional regulator [Bacillota bacterium]
MAQLERSTPVYSMGVVQRLTGLTARQIRYYEEAGLLTPARSKGNRRLYSPDDVDALAVIKKLMDDGFTLDGVRAVLSQKERGKGITAEEMREIAAINHELAMGIQRGHKKLSSLYPVNQQAGLSRILEGFDRRKTNDQTKK